MLSTKQPKKWQKYELLIALHLTSEQEIRNQIKRFKWSDWQLCISELEVLAVQNSGVFIVVKLVKNSEYGQLPNYRIHSSHEINNLCEKIEKIGKYEYDEIWYCLTDVSETTRSLGGRIRIDFSGPVLGQTIEQVWRCSPRLIESIDKSTFKYPYVRCERIEWARHWNLTQIYLPSHYNLIDKECLIRDTYFALNKIEEIRERIEFASYFFGSTGIESVSFEYKIQGSKLSIIDWDTPSDKEVFRLLKW